MPKAYQRPSRLVCKEMGYDALRKFIAEHVPVVSVISKVEVLGYHKLSLENRKKCETVFQALPILPLSDKIIDRAISLRQKRKMSLGDAMFAATALTHHVKIATVNVKDCAWINDLEVVNPVAC